VDVLLGDAEKAREALGWQPTTSLEAMTREMVEHDLDQARQDAVQPSGDGG
jgi:GDPmannose 4,6-dehydratase